MFSVRKRVISTLRHIRPKPAILMYHRVAELDFDPWGLAVSPAHFDEQMALLRASRTVMPVAELVNRYKQNTLPRDAIAVTFDDGYVDNLINAKPILNRHQARATLFLATATIGARVEYWWDELARLILLNSDGIDARVQIGTDAVVLQVPPGQDADTPSWRAWTGPKTPRQTTYLKVWEQLRLRPKDEVARSMDTLRSQIGPGQPAEVDLPMSSNQIKELLADGLVDLGGHSVSHPVLPSRSADEQKHEIAACKAECESLSGRAISGFAYPYGEFDDESMRLVRESGFDWACSTEEKGLGRPVSNLFSLPRIQVMDWKGKTFASALRQII